MKNKNAQQNVPTPVATPARAVIRAPVLSDVDDMDDMNLEVFCSQSYISYNIYYISGVFLLLLPQANMLHFFGNGVNTLGAPCFQSNLELVFVVYV